MRKLKISCSEDKLHEIHLLSYLEFFTASAHRNIYSLLSPFSLSIFFLLLITDHDDGKIQSSGSTIRLYIKLSCCNAPQ